LPIFAPDSMMLNAPIMVFSPIVTLSFITAKSSMYVNVLDSPCSL